MSRSYDRALTVFSPTGQLFQVEYANEAVKKGTCAVAVKGKNAVVLGVEKKSLLQLQDPRTVRKIAMLDEHIQEGQLRCLLRRTIAGLTADARILVDKARIECQSHRLTVEDPVTIEYITRHIAGIQQKYTQSGGVRPFGIATLVIGFDANEQIPRLYLTEPSGIFSAWKANAIGRSSKTVREFLEKNYKDEASTADTIKLAVKSLLEVVQTGAKNIDMAVMEGHGEVRNLTLKEIEEVVAEIEKEKEAEAERKRTRLAATQARAKLYYIRRDSKALAGVQSAIRSSVIPTAQLTPEATRVNKTSPPSKSSDKKKVKKDGQKSSANSVILATLAFLQNIVQTHSYFKSTFQDGQNGFRPPYQAHFVPNDLELYNVRNDAWGLLSLAGILLVLSSAVPWPDVTKIADGISTNNEISLAANDPMKPKIAPSIANALVLVTVAHHFTTGYGCWQHYKLDTHYNFSMGLGVWVNMFLSIVGLATVFIGNSGQAGATTLKGQKKKA
ncbi:MAG: Proteasome subunit alpha type-4 [Cyphobasidiales sp. Tagirdzhanova-0007]|nr:MAG: Proteasome subunit alpha type-4 [Cyphobasidiales sp. Tagirdzhanova-0007]